MNTAAFATDTRLRPLTAYRAVKALMADGEDTKQIFVIFKALRGKSGDKIFQRFRGSPTGQTILREKRSLLKTLEDRDALAALPETSIGRAYFDFMESQNLSAVGLINAMEESGSWQDEALSPDAILFRDRLRDAHDLTHILTGYDRDPLGELCLLNFMNQHSHNLGQKLVIAMAWSKLPKIARKAVKQAGRNGKKARWFLDLDYEDLLPRPLDEVRRELNIADPNLYGAFLGGA